MIFLLSMAFAGDTALYQRALEVLQTHYLWEERLVPGTMFQEAGRALETKVEWLLVEDTPTHLHLHDGRNRWSSDIYLENGTQLPQALGQLEDAVLQGSTTLGLPLDSEIRLPVEILKGLVKPLDRHTVVLAGDGLERFDERISGTLSGVGATIGPDATGQLVVKGLFEGGPAQRGNMQVGDLLLRIDGVSTMGMSSTEATRRIRGPAGTEVKLTVRRQAEELLLTLTRAELTIPNVTGKAGPEGVGLVTIDHFSEQTSTYLQMSLMELADQNLLTPGLIVDLRGNTGGSLLQSAEAADAFLSSGMIVKTGGRSGAPVRGLVPRIDAKADPPPFAMPLLVMMDRATASGSEIMAGSLARLGRALLVGTPSFGKGTVQKTFFIAQDIKLKLTVAEYLLDGDLRVADVGLAPDVELDNVRFGKDTIWYEDPARARARLPAGTPVIPVVVEEGKEDQSLRIAAQLLRAAVGGSRNALLDATAGLLKRLQAEADAALIEAFARYGVDWSAGEPVEEPLLDIKLDGPDWLATGQTGHLHWRIRNRGPALHRAAIRLRSVNSTWDDRLLPLGFVAPDAEMLAELTQTPEPGPSRRDLVELWLEVPGQPARLLQTTSLGVQGPPSSPLRLEARYQPCLPDCPSHHPSVLLEVRNQEKHPIAGFSAHFLFPEQVGVELTDEGSTPKDLPGNGSLSLELGLTLRPQFAAAAVPLELVMDGKERGHLGRWKMALPVDGTPLELEAPQIKLHRLPEQTRPGHVRLSIHASDDHRVDHLVVFAGTETMNRSRATPVQEYTGDKVAWEPGGGRRLNVVLDVPVVAGTNRYTVIAEDDDGLRSSQVVVVLGKG